MDVDAVAAALADRPVRAYPALVSTEAEALAWARAGAPAGAVVLAVHQLSPRGRGGWPWTLDPDRDVAFSLVLRPRLAREREGWLYTVALAGIADVLEGSIAWPDELRREGERVAAAGIQAAPELEWAVVNVVAVAPPGPHPALVARLVAAIEARMSQASTAVLADYLRRCETVGRTVVARLVPLGPAGKSVRGRAVTAKTDGSLVLDADDGRRVAVPPQALGILEEP